jgi:hypothetical protein
MWYSPIINPDSNTNNLQIINQDIPILRCPAVPDSRLTDYVSDYTVMSTITPEAYEATQIPPGAGPEQKNSFWVRSGNWGDISSNFQTYPGILPVEVTDGLSNTWMLFEVAGKPIYWNYGTAYPTAWGSWNWSDPSIVSYITVVANDYPPQPGCLPGRNSFSIARIDHFTAFIWETSRRTSFSRTGP